jgi:(4-(4-[2-(gamma-L-glutamylamino)ethyl]phenoxymethyl)furan-2-yl)methanamine synthase
MPAGVIGLDIGGANLKAAHSDGTAISRPFPLWKQPDQLATAIQELAAALPLANRIAATMTGELCDCFANKEAGVEHILTALRVAIPNKSIHLWRNDGSLVQLEDVGKDLLPLAASNWLALAHFVGRLAPHNGALLVDMGSTTTDIVPLMDGCPRPAGRTDLERIRAGELVYVGASRTPLCALLGPGYAAEWFATIQDAYLLLGMSDENSADRNTADGRPATREFAHARIARMLCADASQLAPSETRQIASEAAKVVKHTVQSALHNIVGRLGRPVEALVIAGSGEFVLKTIAAEALTPPLRIISFQSEFGTSLSECACAFALAQLAHDHLEGAAGA